MCVIEIQMFSFPIFACVNSIKELLWIYVRFLYFTSWSLSSLSSPRASHDEDHYRLLFQITINGNTKRTSYMCMLEYCHSWMCVCTRMYGKHWVEVV